VAVLTTISFTVALGFGIVAPAIPAFARQFGVSTAAAAGVISAFALMRVAGALPAGRLVDRFGEQTVMAAGIAMVAVSSVLAAFSQSFVELLVLRGAGGVGSAMFSISAQTLLLVSVPGGQRGRASGLYSGGFLVGGISGPAVGGLVAGWSLRAPFLIYGGLLVVPAVIAAFGLRDAPARPAATRPVRQFAAIAKALRSSAYRAAAAANLADGFAVIGVRSAIVPLYVRDVLHRPVFWTGLGFLVFALLNATMLLSGGWAADALGRRPVIIAGATVCAGGLVMLALLPSLGGYLAALAVAGLGSGLLDVAPSAMIGDILPAQSGGGRGARGRDQQSGGGRRAGAGAERGGGESRAQERDNQSGSLVASYQMAGDTGAVTGPVVAGLLVDAYSYAAAFEVAAAALGLAAVLGFLAPETRPRVAAAGPGGLPAAAAAAGDGQPSCHR
jgi:DHA1 family multidrug resistance protein-like MFS transporter